MSDTGPVAGAQLKAFVERVERLEEEIKALNDDKADVYAEAKGSGFDVPTMKRVVAYRRKDRAAAEEAETLFDLYLQALGMIPGAPEAEEGSRVHVHARDSSSPVATH